jgi:hypothetical protein
MSVLLLVLLLALGARRAGICRTWPWWIALAVLLPRTKRPLPNAAHCHPVGRYLARGYLLAPGSPVHAIHAKNCGRFHLCITDRIHIRANQARPCLLGVCSDVALLSDSDRQYAASESAELRAKRRARHWPVAAERKAALLIRGFGVRVPGGAPVLTWRFFLRVLDR